MPMPSQRRVETRMAIVVIFTALKALKFAAAVVSVKPSWQSTQATEAPSAYRNLLLSPSSKFPSKKIIVELFMFVIYVNLPSSCSCSVFFCHDFSALFFPSAVGLQWLFYIKFVKFVKFAFCCAFCDFFFVVMASFCYSFCSFTSFL